MPLTMLLIRCFTIVPNILKTISALHLRKGSSKLAAQLVRRHVPSEDQSADITTKPLSSPHFSSLRTKLTISSIGRLSLRGMIKCYGLLLSFTVLLPHFSLSLLWTFHLWGSTIPCVLIFWPLYLSSSSLRIT